MKKILIFFVSAFIISCCSPSLEGIEKDSYECLKEIIAGYPKVEKWQMETPVTMYKDESLCISRTNCHFTNLLGEERDLIEEFVYLVLDGKVYHSLRSIDEDSVYVSREEMPKVQKHTIYRKESYEGALHYRVVETLNKNAENNIPNPLGTGDWKLGEHKDNFGEPSGEFFIYVMGEGTCSGRKMTPALYLLDEFAFKFFDSTKNSIIDFVDYVDLNIKDEEGNVSKIKAIAIEGGYVAVLPESKERFEELVESGGKIICQFSYLDDNYIFSLNLDGYKKMLDIMN